MSIKSQNEIAKERQILATIGSIIAPIFVFILLLAIAYQENEVFDKRYFTLGVMAFAFMFPGELYLNEPIWTMVNKTIIKWTYVSMMLFAIGYTTEYIEYFNDEILLNWVISTPFILVSVNGWVRIIVKQIYTMGLGQKNVIVLGCNVAGLKLGGYLSKNKYVGMKFAGYFDDRSIDRIDEGKESLLGAFSDVANYCNNNRVDQIYLCIPLSQQPRIVNLLNDLKDTTASIYFVPDIFVTDLIQGSLNHINGIPVVAICETPLIGLKATVKRLFDIVLSFLILLMASPVLLWVGIQLKLSSSGPVIFIQKRYGLDGKSIEIYKFRTMTVTENGDNAYTQVVQNDNRVTPFGAFLRKTSLDEFPQFFNVLQGRMSLIGPRPHVVAVNETYRKLIPGYMIRHKVKPGITGWAQVNGFRGGDDLEHMQGRIEYDLEYLRKWSLALDFWILVRTGALLFLGDKKAF